MKAPTGPTRSASRVKPAPKVVSPTRETALKAARLAGDGLQAQHASYSLLVRGNYSTAHLESLRKAASDFAEALQKLIEAETSSSSSSS